MTGEFHDNEMMNKLTAAGQPVNGGRWGTDVEIAHGVAYLLSDKSGFSTGTQLQLDGGCLATWMPQSASSALAQGMAAAAGSS